MKTSIVSFALCMLLAAGAAASVDNVTLQPFTASYDVVYRGIDAGSTHLELKRENGDRYTYTSRSRAHGLFRLFLGNDILQTSTFSLTDAGVQPLQYRGDDGSKSISRDISYDFDWTLRRVKGVEEQQPVNIALIDDVQDPMSIQIALMYDLIRGKTPANYSLVDKKELKTYDYTNEGVARIKTVLGELDTVVYASHRQGSKRKTRMWCAPSLGFIPVQAKQTRDNKREWLMQIISLKR